ncbi:hypothetical protein [Nocardioides jensenii]|uniref:hypothetical protein n=1 Tax=Nocardioides jensenii TaxID=1843 RepID=UPI00082D5005|nr:hypothetical protein [Nocardioides jensenii]
MNRITTMAIASAAVLGIVGGTYAASSGILEGDDQGAKSSSGSTESGGTPTTGTDTPTGEPSTTPDEGQSSDQAPDSNQGELLYLEGGTLHDGDTEVLVSGFKVADVVGLHRVAGGWLVVESLSPQVPDYRATFVDPDGATTPIGELFGPYDVNTDGDSLVAKFKDADTYQVRDARSGEVTDTIGVKAKGDPVGGAVFANRDDVITTWATTTADQTLIGWNLYDKSQFKVKDGFNPAGASPQGDLVASVETLSPWCLHGGAVIGEDKWWKNCDIRPNGALAQFSPDGTEILGIPQQTEGFGPVEFLVIDSSTGKQTDLIKAPELAATAEWATNDAIFVHAYKDSDFNGGVIYRCTLKGECEVEVDSDRAVVLGSAG